MASSTPDSDAEQSTSWPSRHPRDDAQQSGTDAGTQPPPLPDYAEPQTTEDGEGSDSV